MGWKVCNCGANLGCDLESMRVAVTGASGFIGKHLIREMLKSDHEIVAISRHKDSLVEFIGLIDIVELDLADVDDDIYSHLGQPEALIHLAWGGLPNYKSNAHLDEMPMHFEFLELMIKSGLELLMVTGTCFEYGMQSGCLSEVDIPKPMNPYGIAKNELRKEIQKLKLTQSFKFIWPRLFYTFGKEQAKTSIYSQLQQSVVDGKRVFDMSGGNQIRDYLPIEMIVKKLLTLLALNKDIGIVNVCSGLPKRLKDIVEEWKAFNDWNISLNLGYYPYPDYEPFEFWGSNNKCKMLMGRLSDDS
jgi:nucleoside-diphosphate-sugar epimerase